MKKNFYTKLKSLRGEGGCGRIDINNFYTKFRSLCGRGWKDEIFNTIKGLRTALTVFNSSGHCKGKERSKF